jgi:hypothetical protein
MQAQSKSAIAGNKKYAEDEFNAKANAAFNAVINTYRHCLSR